MLFRSRVGIADRHAAATLVEECDPQPDQLDQPCRQSAIDLQRATELHQPQRLFGTMREEPGQPLLKVARRIGPDGVAQTRIPVWRCELGDPGQGKSS